MATIYQFPSNEDHEWARLCEVTTTLLTDLGATLAEIEQLQPCIRERWESLWDPRGIPFEYQLVEPLTEEQRETFRNVLSVQAAKIKQHFYSRYSTMFLEFVKLEFEIVRLKRV